MVVPNFAVFALLIIFCATVMAQSSQASRTRYGLEYVTFQGSGTGGLTAASYGYGFSYAKRSEKQGWSLISKFSYVGFDGIERVLDGGANPARNLRVQGNSTTVAIIPNFHFNLFKSLRAYIGMGGMGELVFVGIPKNSAYTRLEQFDLQKGFGAIYLIGLDVGIGSTKWFLEYTYRSLDLPLFYYNVYRVMGPQVSFGMDW